MQIPIDAVSAPGTPASTDDRRLVAICMCTYRRNQLLQLLLDAMPEVVVPAGWRFELRIVDNDEGGMARELVESYARQPAFPTVHYAVEPARSIALARNRGVDMGPADRVVFIDDDEKPESGWLVELMRVLDERGADAAFGAVAARYPDSAPRWLRRGGLLDKDANDGPIAWTAARTSNTIVDGAWFYTRGFRFDDRFGRTGAEDTDLFRRLAAAGATLHGAPRALVSEDVQPTQLSLAWFWQRNWRSGVNFERLVKDDPTFGHPALRFGKRCLVGVLQVVGHGLPFVFWRSPGFVRGLASLARAGGGLVGWLRPQTIENSAGYASEGCEAASQGRTVVTRKVAFLTNIVSPYRRPVLESLANTPGWEVEVMVNAANEFDREWNVSCEGIRVVQSKSLAFKHKRVMRHPVRFEQVTMRFLPTGLGRDLKRFDPDVVISVELGPRTLVAANYCKRNKKALAVWSYQSRSSITSGGRLRRFVRNYILRRAHAAIGMGIQSRQILASYGVAQERIVDAPNSTDDRTLRNRLESPEGIAEAKRLRETLGAGRRIVVVPARLIPLKGVEEMLAIWRALDAEVREDWTLVFVGDGPLRSLVEAKAELGVQVLAPVPPDQVADLYAMADLHVFSSMGDVWGLVVNEAMLCGTPTLCSVHAACSDDLVDEGVNGFLFDPTNAVEGAAKLAAVLRREDLEAIGRAARRDGRRFTTERLAQCLREGVELALANRGSRTVLE